eukprot:Skav211387  [mRNA]  locus=scaffold2406:234258:241327:- [translate_table: standard]
MSDRAIFALASAISQLASTLQALSDRLTCPRREPASLPDPAPASPRSPDSSFSVHFEYVPDPNAEDYFRFLEESEVPLALLEKGFQKLSSKPPGVRVRVASAYEAGKSARIAIDSDSKYTPRRKLQGSKNRVWIVLRATHSDPFFAHHADEVDKDHPLGLDTSCDKTRMGTLLANRGCQMHEVAERNDAAGVMENPYSSYMKHLPAWQNVKRKSRSSEVRCDSCQFGSPHLKSFRMLGVNVDLAPLARRCKCKTKHLQVQGKYTKQSAVYTDELAKTLAAVVAKGIMASKHLEWSILDGEVKGLECQLSNEVMQTASWEVVSDWKFRVKNHINILEEAALLKLCAILARRGQSLRICIFVDSQVVRCATSKGRSSSFCLSNVLRKVTALATAAGLYISVPYSPTRLNVADDPTRGRDLRLPCQGLQLEEWDQEDLFALAAIRKTKRWASNWIRLVIIALGPSCLHLNRRDMYRQVSLQESFSALPSRQNQVSSKGFDHTLGFPGEGPVLRAFGISQPSHPRRWIFHTGIPVLLLPIAGVRRLPVLSFVLSACLPWGWGGLVGAEAMPIFPSTPGEIRKAAMRQERPELPLGRPVTEATTTLRTRYWQVFERWTAEEGYDLQWLLSNFHSNMGEINAMLSAYGRVLYTKGKSYNMFAETINALSDHQPACRRLLQSAWDLAFAWTKAEPSQHHVAMPFQVVLAMIATALMWGWTRMAGCIALSFGALLRPGELLNACRLDLLLPSDVFQTAAYALLSIREPKSRFTHARHQSARLDAADLVEVAEIAFAKLDGGVKLWPYSGQTYRVRFRSILSALRLPTRAEAGLRVLDPGSLRSGGATWVMQTLEDADLCRRRGRWASHKMMEVYVQETMAVQYLRLISPEAKDVVFATAFAFRSILDQVKIFVQARVPEPAWFLLLSQKQKP